MLTLDPRSGSGDLEPLLRQLDVPLTVEYLPFGDAQIVGNGPEGRPVLVGVEIKRMGDLLQSLMDKRLVGHQLPGLLQAYEVPILLIEGVYTADESRALVIWNASRKRFLPPEGEGRHQWTFEELEERLATLTHRAGVIVAHTVDRRGTAAWLAAQHKWWVGKPYEEHVSHQAMRLKTLHTDDPLGYYSVTRKMKVAADILRGIGDRRARAMSDHFGSIEQMVLAPVPELQQVEGIGEKLAKEFWREVRREE